MLSNCVQLCMMETSGRNKPGNHISSAFGDDDTVHTGVGGPTPIEGTSMHLML
jgi:hypothetical protein